MIIVNHFYALENVSEATESEDTINISAESLIIQVDSNATNFSFQVLGQVDIHSEKFYALSGMNLDLERVNTIDKEGIYTFPIEGIGRFKIKLSQIDGGNINVFCRMVKGA